MVKPKIVSSIEIIGIMQFQYYMYSNIFVIFFKVIKHWIVHSENLLKSLINWEKTLYIS